MNAKSFSKCIRSSSKLISQVWGEVSSAKLQTSVSFKMKNKTFSIILNKIVPRSEPWGTFLSHADQELKVALIFVLCHWLPG